MPSSLLGRCRMPAVLDESLKLALSRHLCTGLGCDGIFTSPKGCDGLGLGIKIYA